MGSGGEVTVELSRVFRSIERGSTMVFGLPYGLVVLCYRRRLLFHIERLCACRTADGCVCGRSVGGQLRDETVCNQGLSEALLLACGEYF